MARAAKLQPGMNSTGPPLMASMRSRVLTTTSSAVASPSRRPTRSNDPGSPDMGERRWDVKATFVNSGVIELNEVGPVDSRGNEWPAYESGGFIQYETPVDLSGVKVRFVFRKSFSIRLNLKCTASGTSGSTVPAAAGADGTVTWAETTDPATVAWVPNTVFAQNDVVDAKALVWLSTDGGEVVADNSNKKISTTIPEWNETKS